MLILPIGEVMRVHLGCGSDIRKGFLNIDMLDLKHQDYYKWDLRKGLPGLVKDAEMIYMSHLNEHLTPKANLALLKECYSKLKIGGELLIELPDFVSGLKAYLNNDWGYYEHPSIRAFAPNGLLSEVLDYALHQRGGDGSPEHVTFIDAPMLLLWLRQARFTTCFQTSYEPGVFNSNDLRRKYSIYFKAIKT